MIQELNTLKFVQEKFLENTLREHTLESTLENYREHTF